MHSLHIDLETIPAQQQWIKDEIRAGIKPPATYKKPDSIAAWMDENADNEAHNEWLKTSFDGSRGEICTIGFAIDNLAASAYQRTDILTEESILQSFFDNLAKLAELDHKASKYFHAQWITHNGIAFDLRFLYQRCVINRIDTHGIKIPVDSRHGSKESFDTLLAWRGWQAKAGGSMAHLCKVLGIDGKNGFDGSMVWGAFQEVRYNEIAEYCALDVERTREIYKRLMLESPVKQNYIEEWAE